MRRLLFLFIVLSGYANAQAIGHFSYNDTDITTSCLYYPLSSSYIGMPCYVLTYNSGMNGLYLRWRSYGAGSGLASIDYLNCSLIDDSCSLVQVWTGSVTSSYTQLILNISSNTGILYIHGENVNIEIDEDSYFIAYSSDYAYRNYISGYNYIMPVVSSIGAVSPSSLTTHCPDYQTYATSYNQTIYGLSYTNFRPECNWIFSENFETSIRYVEVNISNPTIVKESYSNVYLNSMPDFNWTSYSPQSYSEDNVYTIVTENDTINFQCLSNNQRAITGIGWYKHILGENGGSVVDAEDKITSINLTFSNLTYVYEVSCQIESVPCNYYKTLTWRVYVRDFDIPIPSNITNVTTTSTTSTTYASNLTTYTIIVTTTVFLTPNSDNNLTEYNLSKHADDNNITAYASQSLEDNGDLYISLMWLLFVVAIVSLLASFNSKIADNKAVNQVRRYTRR